MKEMRNDGTDGGRRPKSPRRPKDTSEDPRTRATRCVRSSSCRLRRAPRFRGPAFFSWSLGVLLPIFQVQHPVHRLPCLNCSRSTSFVHWTFAALRPSSTSRGNTSSFPEKTQFPKIFTRPHPRRGG